MAKAAEYLGVSDHTLRKFIREGVIPHYRLTDRMIRFSPSELDEWKASRRVGG